MKYNEKIVNRWNDVMEYIGLEYLTIDTQLSELESNKLYYEVQNGITAEWMMHELEYWMSCYYEPGHCRYEDRLEDKESYKRWISEKGKIERLKDKLSKMYYGNELIVEW